MAKPKLFRLLLIAFITTAAVLVTAAVLWRMGLLTDNNEVFVNGTVIVPTSSLDPSDAQVFELPGDAKNAAKPLDELLPDGWKRMKRRIVVDKSERLLKVYAGEHLVKTYFTALGRRPEGPKTKRDDYKTPEGTYYVCSKNPRSSYELSLLISYPSVAEAKAGLGNALIDEATCDTVVSAIESKKTPPQDTPLGSAICIHGGGIGEIADDFSKARISDWTAGCMALRSEDIQEVYDFADPGTIVIIRP